MQKVVTGAEPRSGKTHRIPTREILLQPGSLEELPQVAGRHFMHRPLLCIADANTWEVAGQQAVAMLRDRGTKIDVHRVDRHSQTVHADRQTVDEVVASAERCGAEGLLAVGSGTIGAKPHVSGGLIHGNGINVVG